MQTYLLVVFCFAFNYNVKLIEAYQASYATDFYPVIKHALSESSICRSLSICRYLEASENGKKRENAVEARSYYAGYGTSPLAPALYPAIDTVSVLASLAFLAFLLHSFASLFDRSRSIIPSVVTNRRNSRELEIQDPVKLVLRALYEYDILNNNSNNNNKEYAVLKNTNSSD